MSAISVRVGTRRFLLSDHALERYQERVRPALELAACRDELVRLLAGADVAAVPPAWTRRAADEADCWVLLTDEIVFPVEDGVLVTALDRGGLGDQERAVRAASRAKRSPRTKQFGKVARNERARARRTRDGARAYE